MDTNGENSFPNKSIFFFILPDLPPVEKQFYKESPKIASMSQEVIDQWR